MKQWIIHWKERKRTSHQRLLKMSQITSGCGCKIRVICSQICCSSKDFGKIFSNSYCMTDITQITESLKITLKLILSSDNLFAVLINWIKLLEIHVKCGFKGKFYHMPRTCMQFSWEIIIAELLEPHNYGDIDRDPRACSFAQQSVYIYMNLYLADAITFLKYLLLIDIFYIKGWAN